MTYPLTAAEIRFYHENGYSQPFRVWEGAELESAQRQILQARGVGALEQRSLNPMNLPEIRAINETRINRHLDIPAMNRLCRSRVILDKMESLMGPGLQLWRTSLFARRNEKNTGTGWHRDLFSKVIPDQDQHLQISFHLAVTASQKGNCVAILPRSHRMTDEAVQKTWGLRYNRGTKDRHLGNAGYSGPRFWQTGKRYAVHRDQVRMILQPGECFLLDSRLIHRSDYSPWSLRPDPYVRWGIAARLTAASAKIDQSKVDDGYYGPRPVIQLS